MKVVTTEERCIDINTFAEFCRLLIDMFLQGSHYLSEPMLY